jgi:hypothetical protein
VGFAQAQTPEPTPAATTQAITPDAEPTAEAVSTPEATPSDAIVIEQDGTITIPVDETPSPDGAITLTAVQLILIVVGALFAGTISSGGVAYFIMQDPSRVKMVEQLGNSVPRETADKIVAIVDVFSPILVLVKEAFDNRPYEEKIASGVAQGFAAERQYQRDTLDAQSANRKSSGSVIVGDAASIFTPDKPAHE